MSAELPDRAARAFESHDAFERIDGDDSGSGGKIGDDHEPETAEGRSDDHEPETAEGRSDDHEPETAEGRSDDHEPETAEGSDDDPVPEAVALGDRGPGTPEGGEWFAVTTTLFDGRVTAADTGDWELEYTLEVRTPMLSTATEGDVGSAVEEGWFDTFELRLEDAPMAVPRDVDLEELRVFEEAGDAVAVFTFRWGNADQAPDVAKAIAEYVEGTYVEGVVPGYEYGPPVSELLSRASHAEEESGRGPMPL